MALEAGAECEAWQQDRLQTGGRVVDPALEEDGRSAVQGGAPSCQRAVDGAL